MYVHTWSWAHESVCQVHVPTDLCCSGWFWQWWWYVGVNWSSCCPLWCVPLPHPASSLSLWHVRSCGSAYGSSRAWAGPGHPPPATPSHWTQTHTPPQSARSPPPRSPVERWMHADIQYEHASTQTKKPHTVAHQHSAGHNKLRKQKPGRHLFVLQDSVLQSYFTD